MKKLALLCLVGGLSCHVFAQQKAKDENPHARRLKNANTRRTIGIALTAVGGGLTAIGLSANPSITSAAAVVSGVAALGIGIPLWCVGIHQKNKLMSSQAVSLSLTPHWNGATLCFRF
ncbi:MAG TPA: hypothetical protein VL728_02080 [Cyclobacteriaceae bacterium]|jgi:hypothetical protein|nr:hypothetical protein [Cyclobacteriaceae bacterium]